MGRPMAADAARATPITVSFFLVTERTLSTANMRDHLFGVTRRSRRKRGVTRPARTGRAVIAHSAQGGAGATVAVAGRAIGWTSTDGAGSGPPRPTGWTTTARTV